MFGITGTGCEQKRVRHDLDLSPQSVGQALDDLCDEMHDAADVARLLSEPLDDGITASGEDDLNAELDALLRESSAPASAVPVTAPSIPVIISDIITPAAVSFHPCEVAVDDVRVAEPS
jgi:hypothetical protein